MYSIMSSENSDSFTSSFLIWIPFISFSCQTALTRTSNNMLNNSSEGDILVLFLILEEKLSVLPLSLMLAVGLSYMAFFILRYVPSIPTLLRVFNHKSMLNFVKYFFCIYWDAVFIFQFFDVMYHTDWFADIEESLHPWDKSHLIMVYDPFNVFLD